MITEEASAGTAAGQLWLASMVAITRTRMLSDWAPSSCIAATRIGIDVLAYFGLRARPAPVRFVAYTADAWAHYLAHPDRPAQVGFSIGVGGTGAVIDRGYGTSRWDGHLVIELPDLGWLLDLSLDQASRPHRGLPLGPAVVRLPAAWPDGLALANLADGARLVYEHLDLPVDGWRTAGDWTRRSAQRRRAVGDSIRTIRELAGPVPLFKC